MAGKHFFLKKQRAVTWRERWRNAWHGFGWCATAVREAAILQALRGAGIGCPDVVALGEDGRQSRGEVGLRERLFGSGVAAFQNDVIRGQVARPEFKHALFGIEFYSLDTNMVVYEHNSDRFFVPGSTTKLVTMGSALQLLGPDHRFHTRVYNTGVLGGQGDEHARPVASGGRERLEIRLDARAAARVGRGDRQATRN